MIEAKAWTDVVDKGPVIVFLGKVLDFVAAPRFDVVADSLKVGFIGLAGFTEAARRIMFAFGIVPFSKVGADLSFQFLDLQLAALEKRCDNTGHASSGRTSLTARSSIPPFVAFEQRKLTSIVRVEGEEAIVDLGALRRGSTLYDEARAAHNFALGVYRNGEQELPGMSGGDAMPNITHFNVSDVALYYQALVGPADLADSGTRSQPKRSENARSLISKGVEPFSRCPPLRGQLDTLGEKILFDLRQMDLATLWTRKSD